MCREVWTLEFWRPDLEDEDGHPGYNDDGFRIMSFYGEVFESPEAAKLHVSRVKGYNDVRWVRICHHRIGGVTRDLHNFTDIHRPERVRLLLQRERVITLAGLEEALAS